MGLKKMVKSDSRKINWTQQNAGVYRCDKESSNPHKTFQSYKREHRIHKERVVFSRRCLGREAKHIQT